MNINPFKVPDLNVVVENIREEYQKTGHLRNYFISVVDNPETKSILFNFENHILDRDTFENLIKNLTEIFSQKKEFLKQVQGRVIALQHLIETGDECWKDEQYNLVSTIRHLGKAIYQVEESSKIRELTQEIQVICKNNLYKLEIGASSLERAKFSTNLFLDEPLDPKAIKQEILNDLDRLSIPHVSVVELNEILENEQRIARSLLNAIFDDLPAKERMTLIPEKILELISFKELHGLLFLQPIRYKTTSRSETALHLAAILGEQKQVDLIKSQVDIATFTEMLNHQDKYKANPLFKAVQWNHFELARKLILLGANVNAKDNMNAPVFDLILEAGDLQLIHICLSTCDLDVLAQDYFQRTPLHIASRYIKDVDTLRALLTYPRMRENLLVKDYFGLTPLDVAILCANDEAIKLYTGKSQVDPAEFPNYGKKLITISQDVILDKLIAYLKLKNRDCTVLGNDGHCNGFSFLVGYYKSRGKKQEYYEIRKLIAQWDGKEESLKDVETVKKFSGDYQNLEDLFEHWISDIVWFQHSFNTSETLSYRTVSFAGFTNVQRAEMYDVVKKDSNIVIQTIIPLIEIEPTVESIEVFLKICSLWPNSIIEFSGGNHTTSMYVQEDGEIKYDIKDTEYDDPNSPHELSPFYSYKELAQFIINTKYKMLGLEGRELKITSYQYVKSNEKPQSSMPVIDKATRSALISSSQQAVKNFNPYHFAVLTRDLSLLNGYLSSSSLDVNAKNRSLETPLLMALQIPDNEKLIELLMSHPEIKTEGAIVKAAALGQYPQLEMIFKLSKDRFDINEKDRNLVWQTPIMEAITNNDPKIISLLLAHGADLTRCNLNKKSSFDYASLYGSLATCRQLIAAMPNIDMLDEKGDTFLICALKYGKVDLAHLLIEKGANPELKGGEGLSAFEIAQRSKNPDFVKLLIKA